MQRPALNFYVKFTPKNFKSPASARRARAIFETASPALQNFILAFKFYSRDLALLLKFTPQKSASVFKFSRRRFALNLRAALHAIFAAVEAKILCKNHAFKFSAPFATKNPVPRNFVFLNSMPLNLTLRNSARQNSNPRSFARQSLGQQGCAQQIALARQKFTPQKSACRNRAYKIAALQNFARLNLAASRNLSPLNSAFKFKASADV